ncbi:hypothetical protein R3X27_23380 [Tropicimonas sp. TH_r6]|uniref:hypothetical protein n=1 Tax=Tropicimonas sp. TH_r6 TaxID=3082085 RepID=UPI00295426CC|nr:hypothetical protein [Tropicimonas sp. TH_r6]MDV7145636.1 hypothetical protein [Tropicimonas sp. TH_r6]
MTSLTLSRHAEARMRQRGLRDDDLSLVLEVASAVTSNAFILTDKDVTNEIRRLKRRIQRVERLRGTKVVVAEDTVVTAYHSNPRDQRRTLRLGRDSK